MTPADPISEHLRMLADWSVALTPDAVPADIRAHAGLILWDDLGAMIAARAEPELIALRAKLAETTGRAEATVLDGGSTKVDRYTAALGNGTAADWCELDGGFRPVVCHAALYVLPALLAEAEATNARVDDMLAALLVGYETVARIAKTFAFPVLTLHPHGGLATIGAAAGIAHLRGHDAETRVNAINSAATLVLPGPFNHAVDGALVRNVWPGHCAQNGLRAVDWAEIGITGTDTSLRAVFCDILGATATPTALSQGLGTDWAVSDGYHKMHACCQYGHSTVEALQTALGDLRPAAGDVTSIRIESHDKALKLDNPTPATTLAAKFSMQHIAAATVATGGADAGAFHADVLNDPTVAALRSRVELVPFEPTLPPPHDRPARATVMLSDGRSLTGECLSARGGSDRPFSRAEIIEKSRRTIAPAYPAAPAVMAPIIEGTPGDLRWGDVIRDIG